MVLTPERAPNANAYAERFVRSMKEECLDRMIPMGERHFRRAITAFVEHYHLERNHQGLDNRLIAGKQSANSAGRVHRRSRLGGLLTYYARARDESAEKRNFTRSTCDLNSAKRRCNK